MVVADRLYRSRDDRMLAGVAAGVAEALDADPSIIRIAWALLTIFTGGIALVVYIVMAIVVPEDPGPYGRRDPWGPVAGPPGQPPPGAGPEPASPGWATEPGTAPTTPEEVAVVAGTPPPAEPAGPLPGTTTAARIPPTYWAGDDREARRAVRRARRGSGQPGRGGLVAGTILVVIGAFFLVREFVPWFDWNLWWPIGLIGLGALLLVVALMPGRPSD
jgi:phage shock protein PspC (stress-responsive transcriptional regulator)